MTVGLSTTNTANAWLNVFRGGGNGSNFTAPSTVYVQLHTGDPGSAGASAVSTAGSRQAITFGAAASGVLTSNNTPSWSSWAGTNGEVVTHVSFWDSSSSGTFYWSAALTSSKTMGTGDTLNLTSGSTTVSLTPLAA